jgi:hypothetical protein
MPAQLMEGPFFGLVKAFYNKVHSPFIFPSESLGSSRRFLASPIGSASLPPMGKDSKSKPKDAKGKGKQAAGSSGGDDGGGKGGKGKGGKSADGLGTCTYVKGTAGSLWKALRASVLCA